MHVDADDGTYLITWEAANDNVASHRFYFATDEAALDAMGKASIMAAEGTIPPSPPQ